MLVRHAVSRWLREHGFGADVACSAAEALSMMRGQLPDLVICDLQMPLMDGAEFLRALRSDPRTAEIPVIILWHKGAELPAIHEHVRVFKDIQMESELARVMEELDFPGPT